MVIDNKTLCPCGSGKTFFKCCGCWLTEVLYTSGAKIFIAKPLTYKDLTKLPFLIEHARQDYCKAQEEYILAFKDNEGKIKLRFLNKKNIDDLAEKAGVEVRQIILSILYYQNKNDIQN